ncbi:kynurenine--oxoglutarate transaminase 3-like isoform X2 [Trichogramma pretiosum]|uniref:kynurenine--oxoglutarate transaminase 3-like isoform X2 n=1 Tax=Trichogramma pretiosum TaxID=7493 RepID=UPI000C71B140|nr:kynurenine--oxoglutarate transaminase 3-like isoform X2 [Trichogramma pretiosum]
MRASFLLTLLLSSAITKLSCDAYSRPPQLPNVKPRLSQRFVELYDKIPQIKEYNRYIDNYGAIDLGRGRPDFLPPTFVQRALINATSSLDAPIHQSSPSHGEKVLRVALAELYSELLHRNLSAERNVLVTSSAVDALRLALLAYSSSSSSGSDEWIVLEPCPAAYSRLIQSVGAVPVPLPLRPDHFWSFEPREAARLFGRRTRGVLLANPSEASGKVLTRRELQFLADLASKWNALMLIDESLEFLVYRPARHVRAAAIPRMFQRTITIGSTADTFASSGWPCAWAYGPTRLLNDLKLIQLHVASPPATPIQIAMASVIEHRRIFRADDPTSYVSRYAHELQQKRDFTVALLTVAGMLPVEPQAGHCILANWTSLLETIELGDADEDYRITDWEFARWLAQRLGVALMPLSAFYSENNQQIGRGFVRFCFAKKQKTLEEAANRLLELV